MASDRIVFNPHERFLKSLTDTQRADFRAFMLKPETQQAMTCSIAELTRAGASREQLSGALMFVDVFSNIVEPPQPNLSLPQKSLKAP